MVRISASSAASRDRTNPLQTAVHRVERRGREGRRTGDQLGDLPFRPGMREALSVKAGAGFRLVRPERTDDGRGGSAQAEDHGLGQDGQAGARAMGSAAFGRASGGFT